MVDVQVHIFRRNPPAAKKTRMILFEKIVLL